MIAGSDLMSQKFKGALGRSQISLSCRDKA